jgi:amino acid transporter
VSRFFLFLLIVSIYYMIMFSVWLAMKVINRLTIRPESKPHIAAGEFPGARNTTSGEINFDLVVFSCMYIIFYFVGFDV